MDVNALIAAVARLVYFTESTPLDIPIELLSYIYAVEEIATVVNPDVYNENYKER